MATDRQVASLLAELRAMGSQKADFTQYIAIS